METIVRIDLIKKYMIYKLLDLREFCKFCDISYRELKRIVNGRLNFKMKSLCNIAQKMECQVYELLEPKAIERDMPYI